jgi:hypothetical protein
MKLPTFLRPVIARAEVAREKQLKEFRAEIEAAAGTGDRGQLEALLDRPAQLGLSDEDAALEREQIAGLLAAADLRERLAAGEPPETVKSFHRAVAGETCYFVGPASFPDGLMDQGGKLFVTDKRVLYLGSATHSAAWHDVKEVRHLERDVVLTVQPLDLLRFRCNSYVDTLRVVELSRHLATRARGIERQ